MTIRISHALIVGLMCVALVAGCASKQPGNTSKDPTAQVLKLVTQGDVAWESGAAQDAYDLYQAALDATGSVDADGAVAAKRDLAKHTFLARKVLEQDTGGYDITPLVGIITDHSEATTEVAEARVRIIAFLQHQHDAVSADFPEVRAAIKSEKAYKPPVGAFMARSLKTALSSNTADLAGPFADDVGAALVLLTRAADEALMIKERTWVEDALKDLDTSEATLGELQKQIDKMRATTYAQ